MAIKLKYEKKKTLTTAKILIDTIIYLILK